METPSLHVTSAAKAALAWHMHRVELARPVVCVLWSSSGSMFSLRPDGTEDFRDLGAGWGVGFHDRSKLPEDEIVEIDGLPFVFVEAQVPRLNGATLDFREGHFLVTDCAT